MDLNTQHCAVIGKQSTTGWGADVDLLLLPPTRLSFYFIAISRDATAADEFLPCVTNLYS